MTINSEINKLEKEMDVIIEKRNYTEEDYYEYAHGKKLPFNLGKIEGLKLGQSETIKEVLEILDSRTLECTMQYGQWWMNLEQLKKKIKGTLKRCLKKEHLLGGQ